MSCERAAAASDTVVITGHVSTYGGAAIQGLTVEVRATPARPDTTYSITFLDPDTDGDSIDDRRFVAKSGHIRVGSSDYRLNKKLHRMSSPDTVIVSGIVRNFGGSPVARIRVELTATLEDGTVVTKQATSAPDGWYAIVVPAHEIYSVTFRDSSATTRYRTTVGHIRLGDDDVRLSKRLHRQPR